MSEKAEKKPDAELEEMGEETMSDSFDDDEMKDDSKPRKPSPRKKNSTKGEQKKKSKKGSGDSGAEKQLLAMKEENEKLRDQMLRARAEFENYKRRRKQEFEQLGSLANAGLMEDLLPVLDDMQLFLESAEKVEGSEGLLEGARMIYQKLRGTLEKRGLKEIDAKGEPFDPEKHEALMEMPVEGVDPGTVVQVHQTGYTLGERLLRPSRVIIAAQADEKE